MIFYVKNSRDQYFDTNQKVFEKQQDYILVRLKSIFTFHRVKANVPLPTTLWKKLQLWRSDRVTKRSLNVVEMKTEQFQGCLHTLSGEISNDHFGVIVDLWIVVVDFEKSVFG